MWTVRLTGLVIGGFVVGAIGVAALFPDPQDGPTPGVTRFAVYALCAALVVGMASIPLVVGLLERRAGRPAVLGWRLVLAGGVVLSVAVLGFGAWTWAYPPHDLTECFTGYHHDDGTGAYRICESGRLNRPLGDTRLNQAMAGGALVLVVAAVAAARLRSRSQRSTVQILSGILIRAEAGGSVELAATDMVRADGVNRHSLSIRDPDGHQVGLTTYDVT